LNSWIVTAFAPELEPLSKRLSNETKWHGHTLGVGMVAAAAKMASLLASDRPDGVILAGSCGAYGGAGADVVVGRRILLLDGGVTSGRAAYPGIMPSALDADAELAGRFEAAGCVPGVIGTTLAVTTDDAWALVLAESGAGYENLEAFGVARACADASVPFVAVLGVTNVVGSAGREQWRQNYPVVAERVAEVIARALRTSTTLRSPA